MAYTPKLSIEGFTKKQNLEQELREIPLPLQNIYATVENIRRGIDSEKANIEILIEREPYVVPAIAFQKPHDHVLRLGSLQTALEHFEKSQEYKDAVAAIEPLMAAIEEADSVEQRLAEKAHAAAAALREAEAAALEKARQDPEFLAAQKKLESIEAQRR